MVAVIKNHSFCCNGSATTRNTCVIKQIYLDSMAPQLRKCFIERFERRFIYSTGIPDILSMLFFMCILCCN